MSKILSSILELKEDMKSDWSKELDRINMWEYVKFLYACGFTNETANRIIAFIILSYDKSSGYIELHKDRIVNKTKIMERLGGDMKSEITKSVVEGSHSHTNQIVAWYMDYQADWRWDSVLSCFQYHAEMMRFGSVKTEDTFWGEADKEGKVLRQDVSIEKLAQGNLKKGDNIEKAIEIRLKGEKLLKEMQLEYVNADTIMEKEGHGRMTDASNIMSWEHYVASISTKGH